MKQFTLVFLLLPFAGMAQFNKGQVFLGGSMSAQFQSGDADNIYSTFNVTPKVGYFINEKWAVGIAPGVGASYQTSKSDYVAGRIVTKNNSTSISAAIFGRRYVTISERFLFILEGNLNFFHGRATSTYTQTDTNGVLISTSNTETSLNNFGVYLRPLFIFLPSPKWGIEAGLGNLTVVRQKDLSAHTSLTSVNLSTGALFFGVTYYFKRS